ncbi:MAG: hypothetical protein HRT67_01165 [Flavobacteriaceae bacterium]|nr:hypothetical protein [Flavobacteriaceae bacterium]
MPYYLIVALQVYCIYHLYKHTNNYYWIFAILFLPVLGSLVYLFTHVIRQRDVAKVQDEITTIIHPTKKVNGLKQKLQFLDTFSNRVALADAYFEIKDYANAVDHYTEAIKGNFDNDYYVIQQLIASHFHRNNFKAVVDYAHKIQKEVNFETSKGQYFFALALEETGQSELADTEFRKVDKRYSNYAERLALAKFLVKKSKVNDAKEILNEISIEAQYMNKHNRRLHRTTIKQVHEVLQTL